ncbi:MAG: Hsp20/alpha crystallin family protein [Halobacteriaceae archaeon]
MAVPPRPTRSGSGNLDTSGRLFDRDGKGYDVYREEDTIVVTVELPGVDPDNIDVTWDDGMLTVAAERSKKQTGETKTYQRQFKLMENVDPDEITAEYENGVLEVSVPVPKKPPVSGKEIEIQT